MALNMTVEESIGPINACLEEHDFKYDYWGFILPQLRLLWMGLAPIGKALVANMNAEKWFGTINNCCGVIRLQKKRWQENGQKYNCFGEIWTQKLPWICMSSMEKLWPKIWLLWSDLH